MVYLLRLISVNNYSTFKRDFRVAWLWGYPDLRRKLFGELLSALIEEREKGIEREKEGQQEGTEDHINNVPEVMEESIDVITLVVPQFRLHGPLNHGPGSGPLMADAQADSETRPIDHPPTSDEHLSTVIIVGTEVLEPTSGGQISQPSVGEAATLLKEIEEVPGLSTLDA